MYMELIDRLESRIDEMLLEMSLLREENEQLTQKQAEERSHMEEENRKLREELAEERATKDAVLGRIDGLLDRLKDETGTS